MKRKVTDVDSKVEALKDLLRDRRLSVPVIQYLNFIAQDIQSRNYPAGLERCKAMADSCNFSEISPFMPGIKLLLQLGVQLDL